MGMFDTFVGKTTCIKCGNTVKIAEQTKNFDCLLLDFMIGDYIEEEDSNYVYEFDCYCSNCNETFTVYALIRRGQLVDYRTDISGLNIMDIDNIEASFQRNRDYEDMCKNAYGLDKKSTYSMEPVSVGETIQALGTEWFVDEVYKEFLRKTRNTQLQQLWECLYSDNFIYVCHDLDGRKRLIVSYPKYTLVRDVDLANYNKSADEGEFHTHYQIQMGCSLVKVA